MPRRITQAQYLRLNGKYLREAEVLLEKKDFPQASEKLWGAAAEMVKAVAAKRGRALGTHVSIWRFVEELDREYPQWGLIDQFSYAGNLHTNFYEGWLTARYVTRGLEVVHDFVSKLRSLL